MENNSKKKKLTYLALSTSIILLGASAVGSYFLMQNNKSSASVEYQIYSSVIPVSNNSVQFNLSNLKKLINQKLTLKYWEANLPNPNYKFLNFNVDQAEQNLVLKMGNLDSRIVYNYQILDANNKPIANQGTFRTFNVPDITFISDKKSISFVSDSLNNEFYTNKIFLKYWKYQPGIFAPEQTNLLEVVAEKNEENEVNQSYYFKGIINNLEENTPYVIQLSFSGKEGDIDFQTLIYTMGADSGAKLNFLSSTINTAKLNVSNLSTFLDISKLDSSATFFLKYWEKNQPEKVQFHEFQLKERNSLIEELLNLKSGTEYQAVFVMNQDNEDKISSSTVTFTTDITPFSESFTNILADGENRKVLLSNKNAVVRFGGFVSPHKTLNTNDMQLLVVDSENEQTKKVLNTLSAGSSINIFEIKPKLEYSVNITDTLTSSKKFLNPELTFASEEFKAEFEKISDENNILKYKVTNLTKFYQPEEMKIVFKPIGGDGIIHEFELTDFDAENQTALFQAENLAKGTSYEIRLLPKYSELNSDQDDLTKYALENDVFLYEVQGFVTLSVIKNNFLENPDLKFKLTNLGRDFPVNEQLRLQWRIKPNNLDEAWEIADETNSVEFILNELPSDDSYEIVVQLMNNEKINFGVNTFNQVRLIKVSEPNVDLIKTGEKEFNFDLKVNAELFNEKYVPFSKTSTLQWQKPLINNVVGSGFDGTNYGAVMERHFLGLKTEKQWQDFLGYLAFTGTDAEVNNFIDHLTVSAKGYTIENTTNQYTHKNYLVSAIPSTAELTNYAVPIADNADDKSTSINNYFINNNYNILFGSYAYDADFSVEPYNPSTFISMVSYTYDNREKAWKLEVLDTSNKFKNWNSFPFTVYYKLGKYKQIGLAKDNLYLTNNFLLKAKSEIPASTFNNEKRVEDFINFASENSAWTLSLFESNPLATTKNVFVDDTTGEVFAKIRFRNNENNYLSYYGWVKISDFKVVDKVAPKKDELTITKLPEAIIGPYYLEAIFNMATTETKKSLLEKYFKLDKAQNIDYVPISAEINATDNSKIIFKLKLIKKGINKNTEFSTESEIYDYEISLNQLAGLPDLDLLSTNTKADKTLSDSMKITLGLTKPKGRIFDINWSMAEMYYKIQEAKARDVKDGGTANIEAIKTSFQSKLNSSFDGLDNTLGFVYFRAKGEKIATINHSDLVKYDTILPSENIGFLMKVSDDNTMTTPEEKAKILDDLITNINNYSVD
ncbi:hypothetical protein ACW95P_00120 [Candidatus Mycoplasma pogonae]